MQRCYKSLKISFVRCLYAASLIKKNATEITSGYLARFFLQLTNSLTHCHLSPYENVEGTHKLTKVEEIHRSTDNVQATNIRSEIKIFINKRYIRRSFKIAQQKL